MSTYFKQIIFPPISKVLFDIDNQPMPPVKLLMPGNQDIIDFWFVEIFDYKTGGTNIQMMAACPVCETTFVVRYKIKDIEVMKHALKINQSFYTSYIREHCPKCYPGNPITRDDLRG
jgi:hypothetical protein